ncbi:Uncharacterised protein [[Clostridium] sordellii]|uniref:hypothetical protein n=1 Tax=Paraclostridium sordellii TaxID=1505 RepID=UPI0005E6B849|nr:hypothetical protein [Paeniclostridium sordellii]CEQ22078.1 Uncharacterised protein [[Clostridium] sordellii] [Paeniclostridium sordellii]
MNNYENIKKIELIDMQKVLEKEIDLIQGCINRMSQHSFYLKGWLITLVGIVLALKPVDMILFNICLIFISIMFWYLNAIYLRYEKQYRKIYEWVIRERLKGNTDYLYDLDISKEDRFEEKIDSRVSLMFKNTLIRFYGTITLMLIIILIIMIFKSDISDILTRYFSLIGNLNDTLNNLNINLNKLNIK